LKNGLKWAASHITPVKNFLQQHVDHPIANKAVEIASSLGYGMTGRPNIIINYTIDCIKMI
jgi:hypothetical protein